MVQKSITVAATVTAADPVSGLAYLTGVTCPNGAMSMPEAATPAAGTRVHVLARVAGSTGVRSTAVRVAANAGPWKSKLEAIRGIAPVEEPARKSRIGDLAADLVVASAGQGVLLEAGQTVAEGVRVALELMRAVVAAAPETARISPVTIPKKPDE